MRSISLAAIAAAGLLGAVGTAWGQTLVYENYSSPASTYEVIAPGASEPGVWDEVGDVITLAPGPRTLDSINFSYGNRPVGTDEPANALIDYQFHLYNVGGDGLPVGDPFYTGSVNNSGFSGSTGGFIKSVTFNNGPVLPDTFAWTLELNNRRDNPDATGDGLQTSIVLYTATPPPTFGSTPDGFIVRSATTGEFSETAFTSGRQPRLRLFTIPEPGSASLLVAGSLLVLRRRRA